MATTTIAKTEKLVGKRIRREDPRLITEVVAVYTGADYRKHITRVYGKRALESVLG